MLTFALTNPLSAPLERNAQNSKCNEKSRWGSFRDGDSPLATFTVQTWASATDKGLDANGNMILKIASVLSNNDLNLGSDKLDGV